LRPGRRLVGELLEPHLSGLADLAEGEPKRAALQLDGPELRRLLVPVLEPPHRMPSPAPGSVGMLPLRAGTDNQRRRDLPRKVSASMAGEVKRVWRAATAPGGPVPRRW